MTMSAQFQGYLLDLLEPLGGVTAKRMFGGGGLFLDGTMFAIVADDVLYLKADAENEPDFQDAGSEPFTYEKKSKAVRMSYWRVPEGVLEDPDELETWAKRAWEAARRSGGSGKTKRKP